MAEMPNDDDASVVARVLAGEAQAYRVLVERYQHALFSCAWQLLRSREEAEEAAQEAFVQAYEKLGRLREGRYFFTWAWRICSTVALKQRMRLHRSKPGVEGADTPAPGGLVPVERMERDARIVEALGSLPDEQREALTLRFWEGMEYAEMARLLGISHDALYQRVSRGLKQLKELLGDDFMAEV